MLHRPSTVKMCFAALLSSSPSCRTWQASGAQAALGCNVGKSQFVKISGFRTSSLFRRTADTSEGQDRPPAPENVPTCSDVDISPWDDRLGIYGVHEDALRCECQYRAFSSSVLPMQEDGRKPQWRGQCQKCHLRCPAVDAGSRIRDIATARAGTRRSPAISQNPASRKYDSQISRSGIECAWRALSTFRART